MKKKTDEEEKAKLIDEINKADIRLHRLFEKILKKRTADVYFLFLISDKEQKELNDIKNFSDLVFSRLRDYVEEYF